jgi:hypothetical protein
MKAKLLLVVAIAAVVSACIKGRELPIPNNSKPVLGDSIAPGSLLVNEIASRWSTSIASEYQDFMRRRALGLAGTDNATDYPDGKVKWFEVYNNSQDTIDFSKGGWYFTDEPGTDSGNVKQVVVSSLKLAPLSMAAVYADTFINNPNQAQLHVDYGISRNGGTMGIFYKRPSTERLLLIDTLTYPPGVNNKTWSRVPDGNSVKGQALPTPNAPNQL